MKYFWILLSVGFLLSSCKSVYYDNEVLDSFTSTPVDTSCLQFDGLYYDHLGKHKSKWVEEQLVESAVIYLRRGGYIYYRKGSANVSYYKQSEDSLAFLVPRFISSFGRYRIDGDSIFAYLPEMVDVRGGIFRPYFMHFSGCIKDSNTIEGWRMVEPYPDIKWKFNKRFKELHTEPSTLHFYKTDAVKSLDSLFEGVSEKKMPFRY